VNKPRFYDLEYWPPRSRKAQRVRVGFRSLELLRTLQAGKASRLEMLHRGRPRIGLNAPSTVSLLQRRGFRFAKHRVTAVDEDGNRTWWLEYELQGRIDRATPVTRNPQSIRRVA
jgi:YD repeat-containing protein